MVQEAEAQRENDQKKKENIELKNEADTMIYQTEKSVAEHSAKIPQNIKDQINGDISHLRELMNGTDNDATKEAIEKLRNSSMEIGKSIYAQGNQGGDSQS